MNESPQPRQPAWIQSALVAVLAAQVGLLWLHGGLLNRQHTAIQAMLQDIQDLTEALDDSADNADQTPEQGSFRPASSDFRANQPRRRHFQSHRMRPRLQAVNTIHFVLQDAQDNAPRGEDPTMKDLQNTRDSQKKAIADARDIRQKLSIEENARKAEEKKKVEAATSSFYPLVYWAMGLGLLAFIVGRAWRARAGGR